MLLAASQEGDTTKGALIPIAGQAMPHFFNTEEEVPPSFPPASGMGFD